MRTVTPFALKIVALNLKLKMLSVEDPNVTTGCFGVFVTEKPTNLFRPRPRNGDTQLAVGLQYPIDLFNKTDVIRNMFQDLGTDKTIHRVICQRQTHAVGLNKVHIACRVVRFHICNAGLRRFKI